VPVPLVTTLCSRPRVWFATPSGSTRTDLRSFFTVSSPDLTFVIATGDFDDGENEPYTRLPWFAIDE
jgi:hypothetical protein